MAASTAAAYGCAVFVLAQGTEFPAAFLGLIFQFILGMSVARLVLLRNISWERCATWNAVITMLLVVAVCEVIGIEAVERYLPIFDLIIAFATSAFLIVTVGRLDVARFCFVRWFHTIGRMAYTLYLIHAPILHLAWMAIAVMVSSDWMQFLVLMPIGVALSLGVSSVFFRWFEKPFLRA